MTSGNEQPQVEVIARFAKCPDCGSTDFMMRRLGKEMVEQGLLDEGMDVGVHEVGGPIVDPRRQLLSLSLRPGMFALRDVCIGCGRMVTTKIEKKMTTVGMTTIPGTEAR